MKKFLIFAALMLALGLFAPFAGTAMAAPPIDRHQLSGSTCAGGTQVVNVTMTITNDADSAVWGGTWAIDNFNKSLQIWDEGGGSFCVLASYNGSFVTNGNPSPQGNQSLAPGITGSMSGGYSGTFTNAIFAPNGSLATNGNLGTFDASQAPNWIGAYFSPSGSQVLDQNYWGWIYHTAQNGTWVNDSRGNTGDITGN
jgi:hypothetical protein